MSEKYAIMRFKKIKSLSSVRGAINHINRKIESPFENPHIKNPRIYIGDRPEKYIDFLKERLGEGQKIRKDNVLALEFILTFSPDAIDKDNWLLWSKENYKWLIEEFGKDNVFLFQPHAQEANFHIHAILAPFHEGKLNAKHYINNKQSLRRLQDSYADKMSKFGLKRGVSKNITKRYHKDIRTWQQEQIKEIEEKHQKLEKEINTVDKQLEILDAVNTLMDEDLDFRISVKAKIGEQAVPQQNMHSEEKLLGLHQFTPHLYNK